MFVTGFIICLALPWLVFFIIHMNHERPNEPEPKPVKKPVVIKKKPETKQEILAERMKYLTYKSNITDVLDKLDVDEAPEKDPVLRLDTEYKSAIFTEDGPRYFVKREKPTTDIIKTKLTASEIFDYNFIQWVGKERPTMISAGCKYGLRSKYIIRYGKDDFYVYDGPMLSDEPKLIHYTSRQQINNHIEDLRKKYGANPVITREIPGEPEEEIAEVSEKEWVAFERR